MRFAIRLPDPDCVAPVHLSLIGIYNFINVKFDSDLEREEREIPTRSRPIIVVIVGRETTIYTWEKGEGARNEWNGWDGKVEERKGNDRGKDGPTGPELKYQYHPVTPWTT